MNEDHNLGHSWWEQLDPEHVNEIDYVGYYWMKKSDDLGHSWMNEISDFCFGQPSRFGSM
jgi:hypothetical protein